MSEQKSSKETIGDVLTEKDKIFKIKNCVAKLYAVTYPEICFETEVTLSTNNLFIHGEKIKEMMNATTNGLQCQFNPIWEFHCTSYTEFDDDVDLEKLSYLSKKLMELQRSDAPFKDSVIDFIDLLKRGFGGINASHHNNTLLIDLGYSNAQCECFECLDFPNQGNKMNNYEPNLFSYIDQNAQFIQPFEYFFLDNQLVFPCERHR